MNIEELTALAADTEEKLQGVYRGFARAAEANTRRVLEAFREFRVSEACFAAAGMGA